LLAIQKPIDNSIETNIELKPFSVEDPGSSLEIEIKNKNSLICFPFNSIDQEESGQGNVKRFIVKN
jgi:hypothetical protein